MDAAARRCAALLALALAACGSSSTDATHDPRVLTAHQTYSTLGMVLETTETLELARGVKKVEARELAGFRCYHLLLLGDEDLGDVEMRVLDPQGRPIGTRRVTEGQAAMRVCTESAGSYEIELTCVGHGGHATLTTWVVPRSTCGTPIELLDTDAELVGGEHRRWIVEGSTAEAASNLESGCATGHSPEQIYLLKMRERSFLRAQIETSFDGALSLSTSCGDPQAVIACNDDAGDVRHSLISTMVEPGDYFLVVDGYNGNAGDYRLTLDAVPADQAREEVCARAPDLTLGEPVRLVPGEDDLLDASCRPRGGPEQVFDLHIETRTRLRASVGDGADAILYLHDGCATESPELACVTDSALSRVLDPGHYQLVVEGAAEGAQLLVEGETTEEEDVSGLCGPGIDVQPLPLNGVVRGNTRGAGDRFTPSCVSGGSQDDVYHFRLQETMTVRLVLISLFDGVLHVRRGSCAEPAAEIGCNDDVADNRHSMIIGDLEPGDYYVVVDGFDERAVGEYQLSLVASSPGRLPAQGEW